MLNKEISSEELLFRGVIEDFWDYEKNNVSSSIFKDSKGASVDRQHVRDENDCVAVLTSNPKFTRVCSILTEKVIKNNAIAVYLPEEDNDYHSEIHDSEGVPRINSKSKARNLRDSIHKYYKI